MQKGTQPADRITIAAHSTHPLMSNSLNQIIIEDIRLRNFTKACDGGLTDLYDVAYTFNADGDILRVRTIAAGKIDIAYATPGNTLTWTTLIASNYNGATIPTALAGGGMAVFSSGNNVDVYFQSDTTHIVRIQSTDKGHTFPSAAQAVKTLTTQQSTSLIRMVSPAADLLFYTDSPTSATANTQINYIIYSGGAWGTAVPWDLDYQSLGIHFPVPTPDNASFNSTLGAIQLGTNDYLLVFYAAGIRGESEWGLWSLRVRNVGATPQWGNPQKVWATYPQTNLSGTTTGMPPIYCAFPKLQQVGNEYWITALEMSQYNQSALYHLVYFRSPDGESWTMGDTLAGTDSDWLNGDSTNWTINHLLFAQVLVSSARTFFLSYDTAYVCPSTSLVGQINSARRFDATVAAKKSHSSLPENGDAALLTVDLKPDVVGTLDSKVGDIIVEGAQITFKNGYGTTGNAVGEEIQTAVLSLDRVPELFTRNKATRSIQLTARDLTKNFILDKPSLWWSYNSGRRIYESNFQDVSDFKPLNGNFISANGAINPAAIDPNYTTILDNSGILPYLMKDGWLEIEFAPHSFTNTWVGVVFGAKDNLNYYAILYNRTASKFSLVRATPTTSGVIVYQYGSDLATSGTVTLTSGLKYRLHVRQLHNRILAFYYDYTANSNTGGWTKVIDYVGTGANAIPTTASYWGVVLKGAVAPYPPIGNSTTDGNSIVAVKTTDYLTRRDLSGKFTTPPGGGYLRSITLVLDWGTNSLSGTSGSVGDLSVGIIKSKSDGSPQDIVTNPGDIIYQTTIGQNQVGAGTQKRYTLNIGGSILLDPSATLYVWVHPISTLGVWEFYGVSNNAISTIYPAYTSPDSGQTWSYVTDVSAFAFDWQVGIDAENTGMSITGMNFAEDALPQTFERIAQNICVKAHIMGQAFGQVVSDSFAGALDTGADGTAHTFANNQNGTWATAGGLLTGYNSGATTRTYIRSNTYWGAIGDLVIKCKMRIEAAGKYAGFCFRGGGSPAGGTFTGYTISIGTQTLSSGGNTYDEIVFTKDVDNVPVALNSAYQSITTTRVPCPIAIPVQALFDVLIVSQNGFYQMFVNEQLVGSFFDNSIVVGGEVGMFCIGNNSGGVVAQWDDFSVSDLATIRDTYTIEPGKELRQALRDLVGSDRIMMQMRYDGVFVASRFAKRSSVDTYTMTAQQIQKIRSDEDRFTTVQSSSEDTAMVRHSGAMLDKIGKTRINFLSFPDARNAQQAYEQSAVPIRMMQEREWQWQVSHAPVYTAEREDVVTLVNDDSGESLDVIIKSMEWENNYETKLATGSMLCHRYVAG